MHLRILLAAASAALLTGISLGGCSWIRIQQEKVQEVFPGPSDYQQTDFLRLKQPVYTDKRTIPDDAKKCESNPGFATRHTELCAEYRTLAQANLISQVNARCSTDEDFRDTYRAVCLRVIQRQYWNTGILAQAQDDARFVRPDFYYFVQEKCPPPATSTASSDGTKAASAAKTTSGVQFPPNALKVAQVPSGDVQIMAPKAKGKTNDAVKGSIAISIIPGTRTITVSRGAPAVTRAPKSAAQPKIGDQETTTCVKQVVKLAVDVCVARAYQVDLFHRYADLGLFGIMAATGAASAAAYAADANTATVAGITGGAATMASYLEKGVPTASLSTITTLEGAAESYLKFADFSDGDLDDLDNTVGKYAKLFNAVYLACPSGTY